MKCIDILGGSSDQATADYYRQLNLLAKQRRGGFNTAELVMTSMNFAFAEYCVRNAKLKEMGAYLADRAPGPRARWGRLLSLRVKHLAPYGSQVHGAEYATSSVFPTFRKLLHNAGVLHSRVDIHYFVRIGCSYTQVSA